MFCLRKKRNVECIFDTKAIRLLNPSIFPPNAVHETVHPISFLPSVPQLVKNGEEKNHFFF